MKTIETFTDCHIKTCRCPTGGLFWKSLVPFFRGTYASSVGFKMKTLRKSVLKENVKTKTNSSFAVKATERSNHSLLLPIWWTRFSGICAIMGLKDLNWLCKHMKTSEAANLVFQWIFLLNSVKAEVFHVSIVKGALLGMRKFLESLLKMMKNAYYFILNALAVLKILVFI